VVSQLAKKIELLILTVGVFHARREETISVMVMKMKMRTKVTLSYLSAFTDGLVQLLSHVVRALSSAANTKHVYLLWLCESMQHGPSVLDT
jgi:hypothetical protein